MKVKTKIKADEKIFIPKYETKGAAGADLRSSEEILIYPGVTKLIDTGISVQINENYEGLIRPRSSLSKRSINVSLGTIDSDFRGRLKVCLTNNSDEDFIVCKYDRIAQFVLKPVFQFDWEEVESLEKTERGEGGFGSTGK